MMGSLFRAARPLLHALDPETAHRMTVRALALTPPRSPAPDDPRLAIRMFGRRFPNPVGLAAGFDKRCEIPDQLLSLGFGFVELGGVVPRPQPGNPRPRVFRLTRDEAVINRFGLNSDGLEAARRRLEDRQGRPGIVGVNIGANKDSRDRIADYEACMAGLCGLAHFVTINVSSPNTPGLRDLQGEAFLDDLLARCIEARDRADSGRVERTAVLLKIAPDITLDTLDAIVATALRRGVDALVVSNTTVARPETLKEKRLAAEAGGLSGRPLFGPSTRLLARNVSPSRPIAPARRGRRHRFAAGRPDEDQGRRQPAPALLGADLPWAGGGHGDQGRHPGRNRANGATLEAMVGTEARAIAAG